MDVIAYPGLNVLQGNVEEVHYDTRCGGHMIQAGGDMIQGGTIKLSFEVSDPMRSSEYLRNHNKIKVKKFIQLKV